MKIIPIFLLVTAVSVQADIKNCPMDCKCTLEGASGINVVCTQLNPAEQFFTDVVQHLVVNTSGKAQWSLTDNIFQKMGLQKLESVKIINSRLSDVSAKAFQGLSSLFEVNLSYNQLFLIHAETFTNNSNLHRLKLSGNPMQLTQLLHTSQPYLLRSDSLTEFDLSNCQLSVILPKTFSKLPNLVFVNLASNMLRNISKDLFESVSFLEDLDLSYNHIEKLDQNVFKQNEELSVLKLRGNRIEALNGLNVPRLEELDLSFCKLRLLMKESVEGMPRLTVLNVSNNEIDVISDDSFTGLSELKRLDLSYNKLIGPLPNDMFINNQELELLSLSGNHELGVLVEEPGFLRNHLLMQKLEIADCGLTTLTASQFQGMDNLNVLNVSNNMIRKLNNSVFRNLKYLNVLDLSNNQLESLSVDLFATNINLEKLKLNGNPLKILTLFTFSHTSNLKFLDVSNCELERLWDNSKYGGDEEILSKLIHLDVSKNQLKYLHVRDFLGMENLEAVDLSGNPLECYKSTIDVINFFDSKKIEPYHLNNKLLLNMDPRRSHWNGFINQICTVNGGIKHDQSVTKTDLLLRKFTNKNILSPVAENSPASYTSVDAIVLETDSGMMWPMILAISILIVALYFIIYLISEISHRRRAMAASFTKPGSLGGHVRSRDASGTALYYKLYEECSIPAQPAKKNFVLDFSPIHTILKKNTYRIMRNNEANV